MNVTFVPSKTIKIFNNFPNISIHAIVVGTFTINNKQWFFTDRLGHVWRRSAKPPRQNCSLGAWQKGTTRPMFLVFLLGGVEVLGEPLLQVVGVHVLLTLVKNKILLSDELPDYFLKIFVGVYDHHWPRPWVLGVD